VATASKILVIGGGISGLACAWRLRQLGVPALLLERSRRFGGVIDTIDQDGFRFDIGPQSFTNTPAVSELIDELGLGGDVLTADPRAPRYILKHRRLVPAPLSPSELLMSSLLSLRTKLRILSEPFRRTRPPQTDESIAAFIRRKFGADLLENLVAPFVSGVWAGDPEKLSLRSSFPSIRQLEERHGSVIRGQIKQRRESGGKRASLCNFRAGVKTLVTALTTKLGDAVIAGAELTAIRRSPSAGGPAFEVACNIGGAAESVSTQGLIIATPADETARLLDSIAPEFGELLRRIEYAGVAQVSAGYGLEQINYWNAEKGLEGFGFLVPRTEGLRLLGTVWNSSLFAERAPHGMACFTSFVGGTTDPEIVSKSSEEIAAIAHSELTSVLGLTDVPASQRVTCWPRALPQYHTGHQNVIQSLRHLSAHTPGIFLAGNYFAGPSIGACVEHANEVARNVAQFRSALLASPAAH
jgi:protoporphyrinogen/coproporphyrinogen III oxidase